MIVPVQYDESTDEYFIEFPPSLIEKLGWKTHDVLNWVDNQDGTFTLKKATDENQL